MSKIKSIDEIHYSDESYDVDYVRRLSSASNQSRESNDNNNKSTVIFDPTRRKPSDDGRFSVEPSVADLRYAKTLLAFKSVIPALYEL